MEPGLKEVRLEDANLHIGMRLQLQLQRGAQKIICYSQLIGYEAGEYVLLKLPQENGFAVPIQVGDTVHIRVFSGLSVLAFVCHVESVLLSPRNCMYLTFPPAVQSIPLRHAIRIKVDLSAKAMSCGRNKERWVEGRLGDLSLNGALFTTQSALGQTDDRIKLEFSFPIRSTDQCVKINTEAVVRNARKTARSKGGQEEEANYGLEFSGISQNDQQILQHFIYESVIEGRQ